MAHSKCYSLCRKAKASRLCLSPLHYCFGSVINEAREKRGGLRYMLLFPLDRNGQDLGLDGMGIEMMIISNTAGHCGMYL